MAEKSNQQENVEYLSKITSLQIFYSNSEKLKSSNTNTSPLSASEILHLHGNIEIEEGEEADLHKHYANCEKNPGHPQFIPVKDFTLEHLPVGYHDKDLYDFIKAIADLTVRISVKKVSPNRPEFWPDTIVPYPYYNKRGNEAMRTGSGEIIVFKFIDGHGFSGSGNRIDVLTGKSYESECKTCSCDKCVDSDKPNNIWWEIYIGTATHVVFDEIEASHTSCRLFFDSEDSPLEKLDKLKLSNANIEEDKCMLKYVTCGDFGRQLYEIRLHRRSLLEKILEKYKNRSDILFIVSHPHGYSKQISVGHLKDNHKVREYNKDFDITKLIYTTGTCPGSSGAPVYCVGSDCEHVHAGSLDSGLNYSCVSYFVKN